MSKMDQKDAKNIWEIQQNASILLTDFLNNLEDFLKDLSIPHRRR